MADQNGSGFIGGLAGAVKSEQKEIHTLPMAKWEDVGRIRAQTWNMAGLRIWQITVLLFTVLAWSYTWYAYRRAEIITSNDLTLILNVGLIIISLAAFAVLVYDVRRDVVDSGAQWVVIGVMTVIMIGFVFWFTPVITWSLFNMFLIGSAPIIQIVVAGWIPVMLSIVALSIIPDFQIGRFAWWRELTNQPAASSEKQVEDVTAIKLKQMELDAKHDEMIDAERQEYETKILLLTQKLDQVMQDKPIKQLLPFNHGSARSVNGAEWNKDEWDSLCLFVADFERRGTGRDQWTTRKAEQDWGSRIPEPHWYKIKEMLRGAGMIDPFNKPLLSREDIAAHLGIDLPPRNPPAPLKNAVGG